MRIITGKYKHRRFDIPKGFQARPTTDFAKENIFNVLRAYIDFEQTKALDLFAGTGSISLELLSRGCPQVVSIEKNRRHYAFIKQIQDKLNDTAWEIHCTDALNFIQRAKQPFNLIFADPPYALPELSELPERIFNASLLQPNGLLVLEHGKDNNFDNHTAFVEHRQYGSVNFTIFQKTT